MKSSNLIAVSTFRSTADAQIAKGILDAVGIEPELFVGARADDATQHLFHCKGRMLAAPAATIERLAELLDLDAERIRLWVFARSAAEPRDTWSDDSITLARALA